MRENRTYGSEGGGTETNRLFLPLSCCRRSAAEVETSREELILGFKVTHLARVQSAFQRCH